MKENEVNGEAEESRGYQMRIEDGKAGGVGTRGGKRKLR